MAEKDKGFKFRNLFFRDSDARKTENQNLKKEPAGTKTQADYISDKIPQASGEGQEQSLV